MSGRKEEPVGPILYIYGNGVVSIERQLFGSLCSGIGCERNRAY